MGLFELVDGIVNDDKHSIIVTFGPDRKEGIRVSKNKVDHWQYGWIHNDLCWLHCVIWVFSVSVGITKADGGADYSSMEYGHDDDKKQ